MWASAGEVKASQSAFRNVIGKRGSERASGRTTTIERARARGNIENVKVLSSAAFKPACRSISDKRRARIDMNVTISAKCGTEALLFVWNADNKSAIASDNAGPLLPKLCVQRARCNPPTPLHVRRSSLNTATLECQVRNRPSFIAPRYPDLRPSSADAFFQAR